MWTLSAQLLFNSLIYIVAALDARYECGSHGRFEYCIDGNPSCVIGCHCYPGYYFDTETKICEPNMKLIRTSFDIGSRRIASVIEPPPPPPPPPLPLPPPEPNTESNPAHVDISNKDAEDIGDWLYNQFFKTIEHQVINNNHSETPLVTRRKGGDSIFSSNEIPIDDLITRRSKKKIAKKQKKQEDLRRKLLRISEDDSLFRETKESSSSDDDSSDSSSSESNDKKTKDPKGDKPKHDHDDDDHDVKEIIAFNKVSKPPLPPFVFLPGMQTPFFAPALGPPPGLIPPLMSMFPMGAPMFPPPMPFGGAPLPPGVPGVPGVPGPSVPGVPGPGVLGGMPNPPCNSSSGGNPTASCPGTADSPPSNTNTNSSDPMTIARTLQNFKHKRRLPFRKTGLIKNQKEYLSPDVVDDSYLNTIPNPEEDPAMSHGSPTPEESKTHDFHYLSELIHEPQNKPEHPPKVPNSHLQTYANHQNPTRNQHNVEAKHSHLVPSSLLSGRRSYYEQDDTYYAKLGREIASLIRNINPDADVETGTPQDHNNMERQVDNNERYGSKMYWERAVRSPLHIPENWLQYKTKSNITNDDLYEVENKAKYAATTLPSYNLEQLENIINFINKPNSELAHIFHNRESNVINIVHDIIIENNDNETLNIKLNDSLTPERFGGLLVHSANVVETVTRHTDIHTVSPTNIEHNTEHHFFEEFELTTKHAVLEKHDLTTKSYLYHLPAMNTNVTGIKPTRRTKEIKSENSFKININNIPPRKNKTDAVPSIWEHVKRHNTETIKNFRNFHRHLSQKPKFLKGPHRPGRQTGRPINTTTFRPVTTALPYSRRNHMPFKYFQNSYFERFK